jgi:hypothetical protein
VSTNEDPHLLAEEVTKRGEIFKGQRVGRGSYPPSSSSSSSSTSLSPEDSGSKGVFLPPCPRSHPGGTPKLSPLLPCLPSFIVGTIGLLSHHMLRQGDPPPPQGIAHIPKILHKNACALRKQKLTQLDENELEQTHPGLMTPPLKGIGLGAGF